MKRLLLIVFVLMILAACEDTYDAPPQSQLQISLFNSSTGKSTTSVVSAYGFGADSLWINKDTLSTVYLPLSSGDTTSYRLTFDNITDTVVLIHETRLKYESMMTGFYNEYTLKEVWFTNHRIDSILIADTLVTSEWNENLKFYLHTLSGSGS
jgi:hypothetical protein